MKGVPLTCDECGKANRVRLIYWVERPFAQHLCCDDCYRKRFGVLDFTS